MKEKEIINEYFSKYYPKRNYVYNEVFELIAGLFLGFFFSALKDSISNRALSVVRSFEQPQVSAQFFKDSEKLFGELEGYAKQNKELQERLDALEETLSRLKDAAVVVQQEGTPQNEVLKDNQTVVQATQFTTEFTNFLKQLQESKKEDKKQLEETINTLSVIFLKTIEQIGVSQQAVEDNLNKILKEAQKNGEVTKEQVEEVQAKVETVVTAGVLPPEDTATKDISLLLSDTAPKDITTKITLSNDSTTVVVTVEEPGGKQITLDFLALSAKTTVVALKELEGIIFGSKKTPATELFEKQAQSVVKKVSALALKAPAQVSVTPEKITEVKSGGLEIENPKLLESLKEHKTFREFVLNSFKKNPSFSQKILGAPAPKEEEKTPKEEKTTKEEEAIKEKQKIKQVTVDSVLNGKSFNFYNFISDGILSKSDENSSTIFFNKEDNKYSYKVSIEKFSMSNFKAEDYKNFKSKKAFIINEKILEEHKKLSISNLLHIFQENKLKSRPNPSSKHFTLNSKDFEGSFKASQVEVKFNQNKGYYEITFPTSFLEQISTKLTELLNKELENLFIDKYFSIDYLFLEDKESKLKLSDVKNEKQNVFYFKQSNGKYQFSLFLDNYTLTEKQVSTIKSKEVFFEQDEQSESFFKQVTFEQATINFDVEKSQFEYLISKFKLPKSILIKVQKNLLQKFNEKVTELNEKVTTNLLNKKFSLDSLLSGEKLNLTKSDNNFIAIEAKFGDNVNLELSLDDYELTENKINTLDNKTLTFESLLIKHLFEEKEKATKVTKTGTVDLQQNELQELADKQKFSATVVQKIKQKLLEFLKEQQKIDAELNDAELKRKEDEKMQSGDNAEVTSNEEKPEGEVQQTSEPVEIKKTTEVPEKWPETLYSNKSLKNVLQVGSRLVEQAPKLSTFVRFKLKEVDKKKTFATYVGEVEYDSKDGVTKTDLSSILEAVLNQERTKQLKVKVTYDGTKYTISEIVQKGKLTDSSSSLLTRAVSTGTTGANKGIAEEPFRVGTLDNSTVKVLNTTSLTEEQKSSAVLLLYIGNQLVYLKVNETDLPQTLTTLRVVASQKESKFNVKSYNGITLPIENFVQSEFLEKIKSVKNLLIKLYQQSGYNSALVESRKQTKPQVERVQVGAFTGTNEQKDGWKPSYTVRVPSSSTVEKDEARLKQTPVQPKTVEELEKRSQKLGSEIQQQKNKLGKK